MPQNMIKNMSVCQRVSVYLCATLPFLMSEMIRGSPGFLLDGAGDAQTDRQVKDDFTQRKQENGE